MYTHFKTITRALALMAVSSLCLFNSHSASGQFYTKGSEPAKIRWSTVSTQNFKLIYPEGLDSLAFEYGTALEKWRVPVGGSIGYLPGQQYKRPTPVILHPYNATANGFVTWAPRRMELYTVMSPYESDAMPWIKNLAIHESRHISQMQFGKDGALKIGHYLLGEMFTGALSGIFPSDAFDEGDAVVAETALTTTGRGREADFLEWYRLSFDKGDMRNWYRWRYGSQKYYTPNHYTIGYVGVAGMRYTYDAADFTARYYQRLKNNPLRFRNFQKTIREYSGKNLKKSFAEIAESFNAVWQQEKLQMSSPITYARLTQPSARYTTFTRGVILNDGSIIAVRSGITEASVLVRIDHDGNQSTIRPFSGSTSKIEYSQRQNRLYWSETIQSPRWEMIESSVIRYMDLDDMKIHNLTTEGRLFNPALSPDGKFIVAAEYPISGKNALVVLDADNGTIVRRHYAPENVQLVEPAWTDSGIYTTGIADEGYGIYVLSENGWRTMIRPAAALVKNFRATESGLALTCDITGVNQVYLLHENGYMNQLTSSRYGASDFMIKDNTLYFANLDSDGKGIVKTDVKPVKEYVPFEAHTYAIADKLSEQEKRNGTAESFTTASFSDVKSYRKGANLIKIHSWAPIFFEYDQIEELSFDIENNPVGAGATAMFQNNLGTLYGSVGTSLYKSNGDKLRNSTHLDLTYQGLLPIFEITADYGKDHSIQYGINAYRHGETATAGIVGSYIDTPSFEGSVKAYIPLDFNHGGWYRGLVPQISYTFSNNHIRTGAAIFDDIPTLDGSTFRTFIMSKDGKNAMMHTLNASFRGFIMRPTASSSIYPKFGLGVEIGYRSRIGLDDVFNSNAYLYSYGYLPGIINQHGLRLTALAQRQIGDGLFRENAVTTSPRGFEGSQLSRYLATNQKTQLKITADYAMPVLPVDWTFLCPLFYIRNFELRPHIDIAATADGLLYSTGSAFNVHLGNMMWLPYDTTFGITYSYNGGGAFDKISESLAGDLPKNHVSVTFDVSF